MLETRSTVNIPLNGLQKNYKPTSSTAENGGYSASDGEKGIVGSGGNNGNAENNVVDIPEAVLEKLFRNYVFKQRRAGSKWFIFATFLCNIWILIIPHQSEVVPNGEYFELKAFIISLQLFAFLYLKRFSCFRSAH